MNSLIAFCNLKRQYSNNKDEYQDIIDAVCKDAAFIDGKYVRAFESEFAKFCGIPYAACVNSGTSAIFLALLVMGIGAGDEVVVPSNTFVATAWGPIYTRAKPIFVDCTSDTWQIDSDKVEEAITKNTKAIIGVHLYGLPFDIDAIKRIANKHNLLVIEDCAQAHGALYRGTPVGGFFDAGCFSFYPTKNLGAFGEGGCVLTGNAEYIRQINLLKNHGSDNDGNHECVGFNMRMDGIQAAVLSYRLKSLDSANKKRREIADRYKNEIVNPNIVMQKIPEETVPVYHLFVVTVPDRERFIDYLSSKNIECRVHYRIPCHLQKAFSDLGYKYGDLPNAEYLAEHCVSLPIYPELYDDEVSTIINACNSFDGGA